MPTFKQLYQLVEKTKLIVVPRLQSKGEKGGGCKLTIAIQEKKRTRIVQTLETCTQFKQTWASDFKIKTTKPYKNVS